MPGASLVWGHFANQLDRRARVVPSSRTTGGRGVTYANANGGATDAIAALRAWAPSDRTSSQPSSSPKGKGRARRRRSDRTRRHKSRRPPRPRGAGAAAYRTGSTGRCASSPRTPPFVCLDEARAEKRTARGRTRGLRGVRWDSEKVSRRAVARAYVYVQLQPPRHLGPPSTPHVEDGDSAYGGGGTDVTHDGDAVGDSIHRSRCVS
jgi:hypothetical protein